VGAAGVERTAMNRVFKHLKYPLRHPGIIGRAAENYFRIFALGQARLRGVEFALNYECQCHCGHCSAAFLRRGAARPALPTERLVAALDEMLRLGAMNINLTGGEALLHPDLERIVRAARPARAMVTLASNGLLLDAAAARRLAAWGVRIVTLSIDSADAETHDRFRGHPGCHQAVLDATRFCEAAGIEPYWCTVMTQENVQNGDLLRVVDMARARGVVLTINKPCPVGRWWDKQIALSPEALALHRRLLKRSHVRWEGHSNFRREGCPAGLEKLYVSPYGDVMPCPFIHISYGNLHDRPLAEIWRAMLAAGPFNEIRDGCPISQDEAFAARWIRPLYEQDRQPLPSAAHPELREKAP
jgi:MoaA/NifB/PqqE/SkfB family radical SAM enzyme